MKTRIRLSEGDLHRVVKEATKRVIREANDGGWEVDDFGASDAYEFAIQNGFEEADLNAAIVRYLSGAAIETFAKALAYIFRQYNFRAWADRGDNIANESFHRPRRYHTMLREGQQWVGSYDADNFEYLLKKANELGGNCSFSLGGCDFTMMRTQRGFTVTSGTDHVADSLYLRNACIAAWDYANKTGDFNPRLRWSPSSQAKRPPMAYRGRR